MNARSIDFIAVLIGIILLGFFYPHLKVMVPAPVLLLFVVVYLVAIRAAGLLLGRRLAGFRAKRDSDA